MIGHSDRQIVTELKRDRGAEHGKAMDKVGGPVERIDDPQSFLSGMMRKKIVMPAHFLRQQGERGLAFTQHLHRDFFGLDIGVGHQTELPLLPDFERSDVMFADHLPGLECRFNGTGQPIFNLRHATILTPLPGKESMNFVKRMTPGRYLTLPHRDLYTGTTGVRSRRDLIYGIFHLHLFPLH